jgi:hypothetical protein
VASLRAADITTLMSEFGISPANGPGAAMKDRSAVWAAIKASNASVPAKAPAKAAPAPTPVAAPVALQNATVAQLLGELANRLNVSGGDLVEVLQAYGMMAS